MENQIKAWLKMDIITRSQNNSNEVSQRMEVISQRNIISSLLVNIALHGLENYIKNWYINTWYRTREKNCNVKKRERIGDLGFTRYGENLIITGLGQIDMVEIRKQVAIWLSCKIGLKLSKEKTKIVKVTEGFEFLGFNIILIKVSSRAYRVKIYPSRKSKANLIERTRKIIQYNRAISSFFLINLLNRQIICWANYFRYSECGRDFSKMDYLVFSQVRSWVFRRKSKGLKSRIALKLKYFPEGKSYHFRGKYHKNNWILTGKNSTKLNQIQENFLLKMKWFDPERYVKIKGKVSPYNGNLSYWIKRTEKYSGFNHRISKLIRIQNGRCAKCDVNFTYMDNIRVDHTIFQWKKRSDKYKNLRVYHKHCNCTIQKNHFENSILIKN